MTSYQRTFHPDAPSRPIFSRDLVEVEILDNRGRKVLTVFGTHLKSKFVDFTVPDAVAAAADAELLRTRQADMITRIIANRTSTRQRYRALRRHERHPGLAGAGGVRAGRAGQRAAHADRGGHGEDDGRAAREPGLDVDLQGVGSRGRST